jgi:hypothetical protein
MRGLLLMLTDRIRATLADAGTSARQNSGTRLPGELRDIGVGVTATIALHKHTVLIVGVNQPCLRRRQAVAGSQW